MEAAWDTQSGQKRRSSCSCLTDAAGGYRWDPVGPSSEGHTAPRNEGVAIENWDGQADSSVSAWQV